MKGKDLANQHLKHKTKSRKKTIDWTNEHVDLLLKRCDKPDATNQMPQARCGNNHPQVVFVFRLSGLPRSWCPFFTIIFLQCWAKFRIDIAGLHCHLAIYHNYGKPLCWKGKYSINEHFFHTYVGVPEHILKQKTMYNEYDSM